MAVMRIAVVLIILRQHTPPLVCGWCARVEVGVNDSILRYHAVSSIDDLLQVDDDMNVFLML